MKTDRSKAKTGAKKAGEKSAKKSKMRDLPVLAVATKIRGGKLSANHVELALLG